MSAIILNQSMVHYEALGRGRPIVFLHGWVGSWRYWISSMQVASTSYRAYALDLYGYGDTSHDPLHYSLDKQAALLSGFLDELGIGKIAIVGHGLGALVGFYFAAQQPGSVDRIMAVSCPLDFNSIHSRLKTSEPAELVDWLSNRSPESLNALSDASKADQRAVAASMASFQSDSLFSQFHTSNVPCLLVYGQNDVAMRVPEVEETENLRPPHAPDHPRRFRPFPHDGRYRHLQPPAHRFPGSRIGPQPARISVERGVETQG